MPPNKKKARGGSKSAKRGRGNGSMAKKTKPAKRTERGRKPTPRLGAKGTPGSSRSSTPASQEHYEMSSGRNRGSSMTSRDFIRQVLEFDKESDSESASEYSDAAESTDSEFKRAIELSLVDADQRSHDDSFSSSEDEAFSTTASEESDLIMDDSIYTYDTAGVDQTSQSIYAAMPEIIPENMPKLDLPESSNDLLICREYVLRVAAIYEILRVYRQIIRISPFLFEDFVAALVSEEYNALLHEVFSCLIKTLLREEENNQTAFGPGDLKDSINSLFYFNDAMTYPHIIREYLLSDTLNEFKAAVEALSSPDFITKSIEKKLHVLETLCNLVLATNSVREDLSADGFVKYDDHCRNCQKTGDVICCDGCSGVYHMECVDPPLNQLPAGEWFCSVCTDSKVKGVTDCVNSTEKRSMGRHDPLGFDRHWRKYWFLVRRIIIEGESGEVSYITTEKQFQQMMLNLDGERWERQLVWALNQQKHEILSHFKVTQDLTMERRLNYKRVYLAIDNDENGPSPETNLNSEPSADGVATSHELLADEQADEKEDQVIEVDEYQDQNVEILESLDDNQSQYNEQYVEEYYGEDNRLCGDQYYTITSQPSHVSEVQYAEGVNDDGEDVINTSDMMDYNDSDDDEEGYLDEEEDEEYDINDSYTDESDVMDGQDQLDGAIDSDDDQLDDDDDLFSALSGHAGDSGPVLSSVKQVVVQGGQGDSLNKVRNSSQPTIIIQKPLAGTTAKPMKIITQSQPTIRHNVPNPGVTFVTKLSSTNSGGGAASPVVLDTSSSQAIKTYGSKNQSAGGSLPAVFTATINPGINSKIHSSQTMNLDTQSITKIVPSSSGQIVKIIQASPVSGKPSQIISASSSSNILKIIGGKTTQATSTALASVVNKIVSTAQPSNTQSPSGPTLVTLSGQKIILSSKNEERKPEAKIINLQTIAEPKRIVSAQQNPSQLAIQPSTTQTATVMKVIGATNSQFIVPSSQAGITPITISANPIKPAGSSVTLLQPNIKPKASLPSHMQTVIVVDKDGTRSTIQLPSSALQVGKDGKAMITIPHNSIQVASSGANSTALTSLNSSSSTNSTSTPTGKYITRMRTGNLVPKKFEDFTDLKSLPKEAAPKTKIDEEQKKASLQKYFKKVKMPDINVDEPFKLGMDGQFRNYVNYYSENPLALSKTQSQEERDRKRHLSYKFSLTSVSDFKWIGNPYGPYDVLTSTVISTMLHFEESLPMCYLHPNWAFHRASWVNAVKECCTVERFAILLSLFETNIKPLLFNSAWMESLGHFTMSRQTVKDKEDLKKKEKCEKRRQEQEQEQIILSKVTTIKYMKGLRHQIHKLKGEEYRLSDVTGNGWLWIKAVRPYSLIPQNSVGLRKAAKQLRENNKETLQEYREHREDLVDVSAGLRTHSCYPQVPVPLSKLNDLLRTRVLFERFDQERRKRKLQMQKAVNSEKEGKLTDRSLVSLRQCYSLCCRQRSKPPVFHCYSPLCRKATSNKTNHSQTDIDVEKVEEEILASAANYNISDDEPKLPALKTSNSVSLLEILHIQRELAASKLIPKPSICPAQKFLTRSGRPCPFVLSGHELRALARKAGKKEVVGFSYNCKNAPGFWPYPSPRPRLKTGWEYRLHHGSASLHGIANHLRILWACIRWDDMVTKPPAGGNNTVTTETDITTREILSKRNVGPYKLRSEYRVRTIVIPLNFLEQPRIEINEPIREGLRKRKKHQIKLPAHPTQSLAWVPEEQLELWEISNFASKLLLKKIEKLDVADKSKTPQIQKVLKPVVPVKPPTEPIKIAPYLNTLKVPQNSTEVNSVKEEIEEQLRLQRAAAQAKRLMASQQVAAASPTANSNAAGPEIKVSVMSKPSNPATQINVSPSLASILAGAKPIIANPNQTFLFKGPDGKTIPVKNLGPDQQLLRLPDGKVTIIAKDKLNAIRASLASTAATSSSAPALIASRPPAPVSNTPLTVTVSAAPQKTVTSEGLKNLTSQTVQASLVQAQTLQKQHPSTDMKTSTPVKVPVLPKSEFAAELPKANQEVKLLPKKHGLLEEDGTSLTTDVVQAVVAQALSTTQAPEIQSRLHEMQRKLSTVKGTIAVASVKSKPSPEKLYSDYEEKKPHMPIKPPGFEPKQMTEEEEEVLRLKKMKNKEDYKRRKEKDRLKKYMVLLEKHKNLLRKEVRLKKTMLREQLTQEVEEELHSDVIVSLNKASKKPADRRKISGTEVHRGPAAPPKASAPVHAKKRKLNSPDENGITPTKLDKKSITKPKQLQDKLYCICKQPYDKSRFYVGCDVCAKWFHGSCVGIEEDDAPSIESFVCDLCMQQQRESTDVLYCICRKPYDESQFYVGCDECEGWFHPACVGISQQDAEACDSYICPRCGGTEPAASQNLPINAQTSTALKKLIKNLQTHEMAWPFLYPVDRQKVPDYYQVIKDPMDLNTLNNKLKADIYPTVSDFAKDATKIFNNARYYNAKDTPIFLCAEALEKYFIQKLKEIKNSLCKSNS